MSSTSLDVEAAALLPVLAPSTKNTRMWRGHWSAVWGLWGNLGPMDLVAAILAVHFPYIASAWNNHRALERNFLREIFKWINFLFALFLLGLLSQSLSLSTCGAPAGSPAEHHERMTWPTAPLLGVIFSVRNIFTSHLADTLSDVDSVINHDTSAKHGLADHIPFVQLPQWMACHDLLVATAALVAILVLCIGMVVAMATSRTEIRNRFGIPGTFSNDLALWIFCAPCALAQETRTLMAANVVEGMWESSTAPLTAPSLVVMS